MSEPETRTTDLENIAPKQRVKTTKHEVNPALKGLLDSLQKPHTKFLEAQRGINTDPKNKEKHETDLEDSKKEEADIEQQIKNQFPNLYADDHKFDQEGKPRIRGLQLSRNEFKSSWVIGRIYNATDHILNWYWHGFSGHNNRWDTPEPWSISPHNYGKFKIEIGQLGTMRCKVDYLIDGTERAIFGETIQGYLSTQFSGSYCDLVEGSADVGVGEVK